MAVLGETMGRQPAESWRMLRARRAAPPIRSSDKPRLATFRASLEQAEQQFAAAASIGYDSRPLNLFYGLSQAGRAIAAASSRATGPDWQLEGHGIVARNLGGAMSVGDVELFSQLGVRGSFQRLSQLLDSPVPAGEPGKAVPNSMSVGWRVTDAWPYLLETQFSAELNPSNILVPLYITLPPKEGITAGNGTFPSGAYSVDLHFPRLGRVDAASRPTTAAFLDQYPILRKRSSIGHTWGDHQALLLWANDADQSPRIRHESFRLYRGQRVAMPELLGSGREPHPLMAWWAVLFALSMLARYQPDRWTRMVNVDLHAQATTIEYVLDLAVSAVPDLVDEAIAAVAT